MEAKLMDRIKEQLVRHEGLRLKPYRCTAGKLTIGIGRNLYDWGIFRNEAYAMLERDIQDCEQWLIDKIPHIYNNLDEVRQSVLLNMCFNLGIKGLLGFKNTLAFIKAGDWERAANGMLASKWANTTSLALLQLVFSSFHISTIPGRDRSTYILWGEDGPHLRPALWRGSSWGQPYNL